LLAIGFSFSVAQQQMTDVVYLKNGSIIKCIILEQNVGKNIKIQTIDGSIYVYKYDELEKIEKITTTTDKSSVSPTNPKESDSTNLNPFVLYTRPYYIITPMDGVDGISYLSFHIGKVFNESNFIRVGCEIPRYYYRNVGYFVETSLFVGYEYYFNGFTQNSFNIQTSLDYHFVDDYNSLGFSLGIGYSFKLPGGNLGIIVNYSYMDESLSVVRLGFSFGRY
jgi:hypothetical protein